MNNPERNCAFLIHDATRLIRRRFESAVADLNITEAKWRVLGALQRRPGMTQSQIADRLGIEKAPAGLALDWLEAKGWIRRETDASDRRVRRVWLDEAAAPTIACMFDRFRGVELNYLRGFEDDEIADLSASLRIIRQDLRTADPEPEGPSELPDTYLTILFDCARLLMKRFDARLAELGFTRNEWLVLTTITRHEGQRQARIAELCHLAVAPLGKVVDALERRKWLERRADAQDRRAKRLFITPRARTLMTATCARVEAVHERLVAPLAADQCERLTASLSWIRQRLLEDPVTTDHKRAGAL